MNCTIYLGRFLGAAAVLLFLFFAAAVTIFPSQAQHSPFSFLLQQKEQPFLLAENFYSTSEQQHTRSFLRSIAAGIPDLQPRWTGDNYCSWDEIHCSGSGVVVDFTGLNITTSNSSLPDLPADVDGAEVSVTHIYLYHQGQKLQGSLPASWGRLRRLKSLFLIDNALSGTLPDEWGTLAEMKELESLMLSLNNFTGTIPASWSSLTRLQTVVLSANNLTGSLPAAWGDMPILFYADVSGNSLCGCIPREWKSQKALKVVADAAVTASDCATANACVSSSSGTH